MVETTPRKPLLPPDDLNRGLRFAQVDGGTAQHIGLVGDTYTITVAGEDTNDRFCVIDMHVPPGGGPGPHRHDFEETFILLDGEMEVTFRGKKSTVHAGETINIPSNAPHQFHNASDEAVRMICICSPAGNDKFFLEVGVTRDHAHHAAAQARREADGRISGEGKGNCPKVPDRTSG